MSERAKNAAEPAQAAKIHYCSFCLKPQDEVRKLVAGRGNIFICDECVEICSECIAGRTPDLSRRKPAEELPTERLLAQLGPIEETVQGKGNQLQWVIDTLRSRKVSWARIGAALAMSRQSAWERFS